MTFASPPPLIERLVLSLAALSLGGAVATMLWAVAGGAVVAAVVGVAVAGVTFALLSREAPGGLFAFELASVEPAEPEELLLDQPFISAAQYPANEATVALPDPGEMIARIEDYLGRGSIGRQREAARADASAALHAALADIRASLR